MSEPTKEQIKEFWEWCGFSYYKRQDSDFWLDVHYPHYEKTQQRCTRSGIEPHIDLNNLFKYTVPKVLEEYTLIETYSFKQASGRYYAETCIWDRGKVNNIDVLKGKLVAKSFAQSFNLEEAETLSRFQVIWEVITK